MKRQTDAGDTGGTVGHCASLTYQSSNRPDEADNLALSSGMFRILYHIARSVLQLGRCI